MTAAVGNVYRKVEVRGRHSQRGSISTESSGRVVLLPRI